MTKVRVGKKFVRSKKFEKFNVREEKERVERRRSFRGGVGIKGESFLVCLRF